MAPLIFIKFCPSKRIIIKFSIELLKGGDRNGCTSSS